MGIRVWGTALLLACAFGVAETAWSRDGSPKRAKVIDFEDELVEGMNKRPLDSLSQIGEKGRKKKNTHLYRKRVGFTAETETTLSEARYAQ